MRKLIVTGFGIIFLCCLTSCRYASTVKPTSGMDLDEVYATWNFYRHAYLQEGRVIENANQGITSSQGQGYALLYAVWADDPSTFQQVWQWTQKNLQGRSDHLFVSRWKDVVVDSRTHTGANTDIALALILAARRFSRPDYQIEAIPILNSLWNHAVFSFNNRYFITTDDEGESARIAKVNVGDLSPYAYSIFSTVDPIHPWTHLVDSSYDLLKWIYFDQGYALPPDTVYIDKNEGHFLMEPPEATQKPTFSADTFPLFWRIALDARWYSYRQGHPYLQMSRYLQKGKEVLTPEFVETIFVSEQHRLRQAMLRFFQKEWSMQGSYVDHYSCQGERLSTVEAPALYATVHTLALVSHKTLAHALWKEKLDVLWRDALTTKQFIHLDSLNWLWADRAFQLNLIVRYDEFLGFLRPFDVAGFLANFPILPFLIMIGFYLLAPYARIFKFFFLACATAICLRYLVWRGLYTLNFIEPAGPFVSISLWLTECYSFITVLLVFVQLGLSNRKKRVPPRMPTSSTPSVDIFIPIYSEPIDILEKTLIGARAIRYPKKEIYVCDDSHREEVASCAARYGAHYLRGPKKHAKAGNLNAAMPQSSGELLVVFDTDHIPVSSFLEETVPYFADPELGFIQTPHHFYNEDIFQRAFGTGQQIPAEQDMFHHGIQGRRDNWGGSFFVGSGAIFRRCAIEQVGGFKLMSITEDVHTSMYLHEAGWKSLFVDKDLAVGLNAENLRSHVIQRRRWMLGALQIFFRDNPLFHGGLSWRHAMGYMASLSYFFFPIFRFMIWITPMWYLLFHWHPILANGSVLAGYLVPYLITVPLISNALLPEWPRLLWGELYDATVTLPLLMSMGDLLWPKRLGFKVTPKGIISQKRSFDWGSSWMTLGITSITAFAIAKGLAEFFYYGIEKEAYFFNLVWASLILIVSVGAVLVAWERPQLRKEERLHFKIPFTLKTAMGTFEGITRDIGLIGFSCETPIRETFTHSATLKLEFKTPVVLDVRLIYNEPTTNHLYRCGWEFTNIRPQAFEALVLELFANEKRWADAHDRHVQSNWAIAFLLLKGILHFFRPLEQRRRRSARLHVRQRMQLQLRSKQLRVFVRNQSTDGMHIRYLGRRIPPQTRGVIYGHKETTTYPVKIAYVQNVFPGVWNAGLTLCQAGAEITNPGDEVTHDE